MLKFVKRLCSLLFGLFLYAFGIVLTIQANIGYAPWDVLHVGLSYKLGISIGMAGIGVGLIICLIVFFFGEKLGLGTILNIVIIGLFIDAIFVINIIPAMNNLWLGILLLIGGLFTIALGSYFYIGSAFGAGPRDSLMTLLKRRFRWPVGLCRSLQEGSALVVGYLLGGQVGIGTLIATVGIGFCVQIVFGILHFNPAEVKHETLADTWRNLCLPTLK